MGIWGEIWGNGPFSRSWTGGGDTTSHSCNTYSSNFVAVSQVCACWGERVRDGASTSDAPYGDWNCSVLQEEWVHALRSPFDVRELKFAHCILERGQLHPDDTGDKALWIPYGTRNVASTGFWDAALSLCTYDLGRVYSNENGVLKSGMLLGYAG